MNLRNADELLLHRFLDHELDASAAAELQARLAAEPALREFLEAEQHRRAGFAALRSAVRTAPASFTASVLAATRRLPNRQELESLEQAGGIRQLCRRLLIAAALLLGLGLAWHGGLFDRVRGDTVQAAPESEIRRELERLDQLIQSGVVESPSGHQDVGNQDLGHQGAESRAK